MQEERIDFCIITVRADEYKAVVQRFHPVVPQNGKSGHKYGISKIQTKDGQNRTVAIARSADQGSQAAQQVAYNMIADLSPSLLLVVGIASAVPHHDFTLGDVVVSSRIHDFSVNAFKPEEIQWDVRGGVHPNVREIVASLPYYDDSLQGWNSEPSMGNAIRPVLDRANFKDFDITSMTNDDLQRIFDGTIAESWQRTILDALKWHFGNPPQRLAQPLYTIGEIASSGSLIRDTSILTQWLQNVRNIRAIDMESSGVFQAAQQIRQQYPVIAIRGISDIVGLRRDGSWTNYACHSAAAFTYTLLIANSAIFDNIRLASSSQTILSPHPVISGFTSDDPNGQDQLGFQREVEALCSVLAAKEVQLPIALGLFGDWGSGKSFFMRMMQNQIDRLKRVALNTKGETAYCKNVIQLTFNAWHYIDTDLWASLASEIFEGLAGALASTDSTDSTEEDKAYGRLQADAEAGKSKNELEEAKSEERDAIAKLEEIKTNHQKLKNEKRTIFALSTILNHVLKQSEVQGITNEINKNFNLNLGEVSPDLHTTLGEVQKELNKSGAKETVEAIKDELQNPKFKLDSVIGRIRTFFKALRKSDRRRRLRILVGIVGVAVITLILIWLSISYVSLLTGILIGIMTLTFGVLVTLAPFFSIVNLLINKLKEVQMALETAQKRKEEDYHKKIDDMNKRIDQAKERVARAEKIYEKKKKEVQKLRNQKVSDFIKQRHASTDYSRHLGLIARARDDFEKLSILLAKEREATKKGEETSDDQGKRLLPPIDRIILYIDDLDRCPEKKVVEVLQAVHLLLAFPLFVVVVGVDSRWLLHSLKQHSEVFQNQHEGTPDNELTQWQATPLNYMEKIFQIPYTLRPMQSTGFEHLIDMLASQQKRAEAAKEDNGDIYEKAEKTEEAPAYQDKFSVSPEITRPLQVDLSPDEEIDMNPEYLQIEEWERAVMKKLYHFMPSPRAVKRFVNIYRLLKASVDKRKLQAFTGDSTQGQHRSTLLLLSMLIGYSTESTEIFNKLLKEESTKTWWDFIDSLQERADTSLLPVNMTTRAKLEEAERWQKLFKALNEKEVRSLIPKNQSCTDFIEWVPQVARYSYQSTPAVFTL